MLTINLGGNGVFIKKIGKQVYPEKGFTVVATANTKGKGSDDGRFVGTNVLNEASLEDSTHIRAKYPSIRSNRSYYITTAQS